MNFSVIWADKNDNRVGTQFFATVETAVDFAKALNRRGFITKIYPLVRN